MMKQARTPAPEDGLDLSGFEGIEAEPDRVARYPADASMIRNWVEALDDRNPIYVDPQAARLAGRTGIVAPPAMISTWVMSGYRRYREVQDMRAQQVAGHTAYSTLMAALDEAGYDSVVGTDVEQEYLREVQPGTVVTCSYLIESVSPPKNTALGVGRFVTLFKRYVDQQGETLCTERFRLLRFRPAPTPPATEIPARRTGVPPLVRTQDTAFWFDAAAEGRLVIQKCTDCGLLRHPPTPTCPKCRSFQWDSIESTRRATLNSWTVVHHPQDPAFEYPLAIGLVDLEEGTRLVADIRGIPHDDLEEGMAMEVVFTPHAHGEMLPSLQRAEGQS